MEALQGGFNLVKGKRTRRLRQSSSFVVAAASTSSTGSGENSVNWEEEEEEEVANSLILLARGIRSPVDERVDEEGDLVCEIRKKEKNSMTGSDAYQCKTCNRTFLSFQALGGHRASHKKPKLTVDVTQEYMINDRRQKVELKEEIDTIKMRLMSKINNKVHECSICGAEFSSGQALGGHMRRHRSPAPPPAIINEDSDQNKKKVRNLLELDLNLPAPVEDDTIFQYISPKIVFSGPTLVGCHY